MLLPLAPVALAAQCCGGTEIALISNDSYLIAARTMAVLEEGEERAARLLQHSDALGMIVQASDCRTNDAGKKKDATLTHRESS